MAVSRMQMRSKASAWLAPLILLGIIQVLPSKSLGTGATGCTQVTAEGQTVDVAPVEDHSEPAGTKINQYYKCPPGSIGNPVQYMLQVPAPVTKKDSSGDNSSGNNGGDGGGGGNQNNSPSDQAQSPPPQNSNGSQDIRDPADNASGAGCGGGRADQDSAGQMNCQARSDIKQAVDALKQLGVTNASALASAYQKYEKAQKACNDSHSTAASACLENMSKDVSGGLAGVNDAMSQVGGASSNASCSQMGKIMDMANKALTAFTGTCGAAKGLCGNSCGDAKTSLDQLKSTAAKSTCNPNDQKCEMGKSGAISAVSSSVQPEMSTSDQTAIAAKKQLCDKKYAEQMASAMKGIAAMLQGMMQGDQCKKETDAVAAAAGVPDCTDPTLAKTPKCLCVENPRLPGCENALQKLGDSAGGVSGISSLSAPMGSDVAGGPNLGNGGPDVPDFSKDSSGDAAAAGGAAGGGASLGGSSGLGAAPGANAGEGEGGGRGLNTNILAGTGSGGGAGGGFNAGRGLANDAKYKDYLPGGAKDPNKLGGAAFAKEVTGQGKSNWDKIKERYRDNKPSLLNN